MELNICNNNYDFIRTITILWEQLAPDLVLLIYTAEKKMNAYNSGHYQSKNLIEISVLNISVR